MDEGVSSETVIAFLKRNLFLAGVTLTCLLLLGFGFLSSGILQPQDESVVFEAASIEDSASNEASGKTVGRGEKATERIFVDIAGAVESPGVYEVSSDARVQDVLTKAGGLSENADHQGIAKSMNLASAVNDGMKLYFPFKGEAAVLGNTATETTGSTVQTGSGLIPLNTATQSELDELPGIGEVTAKKIIDGRPYASVQELREKKIVGESVYGKIKDLVSLN